MTLWLRVVSFAFVIWLVPQLGAAQGEQVEKAASDRAATFEAVTGAVQEDVPGGPLLVIAYGIVWLAVFAYVFRLVRLHKSVDDNLARLEQDLVKAASRAGASK
jgi:CcmD family protein